jgi:hypothetical protein
MNPLLVKYANDLANGNCFLSKKEIKSVIKQLNEAKNVLNSLSDYCLATRCLYADISTLENILYNRECSKSRTGK